MSTCYRPIVRVFSLTACKCATIIRLTLRRDRFRHINAHITISLIHKQLVWRPYRRFWIQWQHKSSNTQRRLQLRGTSTKRKINASRRSISSPSHSWQPQKPIFCAPRLNRWTHSHIGSKSRTTAIRWPRSLRPIPLRQINRPLASTLATLTKGTQRCISFFLSFLGFEDPT